jgi:hypothetical protein
MTASNLQQTLTATHIVAPARPYAVYAVDADGETLYRLGEVWAGTQAEAEADAAREYGPRRLHVEA